jgi:hypothetical protein
VYVYKIVEFIVFIYSDMAINKTDITRPKLEHNCPLIFFQVRRQFNFLSFSREDYLAQKNRTHLTNKQILNNLETKVFFCFFFFFLKEKERVTHAQAVYYSSKNSKRKI